MSSSFAAGSGFSTCIPEGTLPQRSLKCSVQCSADNRRCAYGAALCCRYNKDTDASLYLRVSHSAATARHTAAQRSTTQRYDPIVIDPIKYPEYPEYPEYPN